MNPAIIIPAFSRHRSLQRLLKSIESAIYPHNNIKLIISLDGGASQDVISIAKAFKFSHGTVEIIIRNQNIGLRNHILWCGDQSDAYGSVIILEDDLYVDPHFYYYATASLNYYSNDENIAGIALYSQKINEYSMLPFEPMHDMSSTYFMQVPCSWGQAWTKKQWNEFKTWYTDDNRDELNTIIRLPEAVKKWPESSWKKYYAAYMVIKNRYFVYPYISYTTNCSDSGGVHIKNGSTLFHVPMPISKRLIENFNFQLFNQSLIKYDSFMEPIYIEEIENENIDPNSIEIDFYGLKPIELLKKKEYVITSRRCFDPAKTYDLSFKPIEKLFNSPVVSFNSRNIANPVYLVKSQNITSDDNSGYKLLSYFCYFPIYSKRFLINYFKHFIKVIIRKVLQ